MFLLARNFLGKLEILPNWLAIALHRLENSAPPLRLPSCCSLLGTLQRYDSGLRYFELAFHFTFFYITYFVRQTLDLNVLGKV